MKMIIFAKKFEGPNGEFLAAIIQAQSDYLPQREREREREKEFERDGGKIKYSESFRSSNVCVFVSASTWMRDLEFTYCCVF